MALRKIKLYGKLGQMFGREWNLDVKSVGEAVRAIDANTNGEFSKYLIRGDGSKYHYKIAVKKKSNLISKEEISGSFGSGTIYITPSIKGSGKYGQIIAGVVLIAVSYYMGGFGAGAANGAMGSTAMYGSYIGQVGIALAIGGIAQLLMSSKGESSDQRNSYLFQGNASTVYQGTSVGIAYGRILVSPMPVCVSTMSEHVDNYNGALVEFGPLNETITEFLYSYAGGGATLCGFEEFADPSTPPKKYRKVTASGTNSITTPWWCDTDPCGITTTMEYSGYDEYSAACSLGIHGVQKQTGIVCGVYRDYGTSYLSVMDIIFNPCYSFMYSGVCTETATKITKTNSVVNSECGGSGTGLIRTLSIEDTDSDAISRLMQTATWSPYTTSYVAAIREQRTTGFSFSYREVKIKTKTSVKFNHGISYKYDYTVQRRIYGSSDPFVDAETISSSGSPNAEGDFEINVENVAGYESKISNLIVTL